ncbi:YggS family pyridoxal phosphate-dependent enzyme [Basfia succiniciproducens]|uniref:YggS family pyridoxal phosphate-dependent enzyme n=1 Tax=Basfia succiniciproducens TaxID=653940 RepID=UPI003FCE3C56
MEITNNLKQIHKNIVSICQNAGLPSNSVKLLAVSKTKPVEDLEQAYQAGQRAFGENYVQEGVEKIEFFQAKHPDMEWHFIGPLQSNKTRLVAEYFDWMQTVDREKIAIRLNEQRPVDKSPLNVLIQINISDEESKSGIKPADMMAMAKIIENLPHLRLRGLMAIPAATHDAAIQAQSFSAMHKLFVELQQSLSNQRIDTLSMGMTDDMTAAIKCGSTMVRIGTAIFGSRN